MLPTTTHHEKQNVSTKDTEKGSCISVRKLMHTHVHGINLMLYLNTKQLLHDKVELFIACSSQ